MPSAIATRIANGHAWTNHRGEFPEIKTATDFAEHIDRIIAAPTESRKLNQAREA
jgi:hypothetical protein